MTELCISFICLGRTACPTLISDLRFSNRITLHKHLLHAAGIRHASMPCFNLRRSEQCKRISKFSFFFTSQQKFDKDIAAGKEATKDHTIAAVPIDSNRVDYNKTGVHEIGEDNFKAFVAEQDVCLVLFYSKDGENSDIAKEALSKAAGVTNRPYSTFAQVDCNKNFDLCNREMVTSLPFYRMYSKGATVGTIRDYLSFPSLSMQAYVENCPVITQAPRPTA